uniref:Uncharacterized protein n=1 Tax=Acrobeloides nanus TaxID=290746 RepID=A0A914DY76_9BILA
MNSSVSVHDVSCQVNAADFAPLTQLKIDTPRSLQNDVALVKVPSTKNEHGYKKVINGKKSAMEATNAITKIKKNKKR